MEIEELGLSVRAYNAVKRYGINTTEELAERIDEFCKHAPKYGAEAREALSKVSAPQPSGVIVESAEYTRAIRLHRCICANAQAAQESLYEMCKALKEMRDSRLYKELGYSELNDYCKSELGMSDRTAYKYISIAENFAADDNLVKSSSLIGREKLALLAKLDEQERTEIVQNTDLESTSVRELKAKISELERDLKTQQANYSMHTKQREDEIARLQSSNAVLQGNITDEQKKSAKLQTQLESKHREWLQACDEKTSYAQRLFHAEETVRSLENQVDELESRPVEVTAKPDEELIKQHLKELDDMQREHKEELSELKEKYQKQMREGIEKAKKEAQAPDIGELWRALDTALDNAIEAIEDFFDDYDSHPKIKTYANALKKTVRDLNTMVNNVLAGEK